MARDNDGSSQDAYIERMLSFLFEEGGAGATVGPDGLRLGIPNWEEATKELGPSERAKTHGYPFGFAKSQWHLRDRLVARFRLRARGWSHEQKVAHVQAHEAVSRALDSERLLGSFNYDNYCDRDHFPLATLDQVADNLIGWLDHLGFAIVAKEQGVEDELPEVAWRAPTVFDEEKGMVMLFSPKSDDGRAGGTDDEAGAGDGGPAVGTGQREPGDPDGGQHDGLGAQFRSLLNDEGHAAHGDAEAEGEVEDDEDDEADDGEEDVWVTCQTCEGVGEVPVRGPSEDGEEEDGEEEDDDDEDTVWETCAECEGKGRVPSESSDQCPFCSGAGERYGCEECDDGRVRSAVEANHRFDLEQFNLLGYFVDYANVDRIFADIGGIPGGDLADRDLQMFSLGGIDLTRANLSRVCLQDVELSRANLTETNLTDADLTGANLTGANLAGATLTGANPEATASLQGADLRGVVGLSEEQRAACRAKGAYVDDRPASNVAPLPPSPDTA